MHVSYWRGTFLRVLQWLLTHRENGSYHCALKKGNFMSGWIVGRVVSLVGVLGLPGVVHAQDSATSSFTSQAQAESYLKENPTGPRAKAAFLAIVEFQLAQENPGFSRSDIAKGVNLREAGTPARPASPTANNERDGGGVIY